MSQDTELTDAGRIAASYFESWRTKDFATFRSLLADDVTFDGPLGTAANAEECVRGIEGMSKIVTDIVVHKIFVSGDDVLTWFDLHTEHAPPCPTANWSQLRDGRIARIRVAFDPRPLVSDS
ncbi:MAG TPA: nuclear transport factor 2 family protein [Pseudonocardiaceae bacterium]|jgi:ketosteroid isomerase-like protein|nr:nuclear transport factor 2 family protein [Pseudonocardiaceae bacterium]